MQCRLNCALSKPPIHRPAVCADTKMSSQMINLNDRAIHETSRSHEMLTWSQPWWVLRTRARHEKVLAGLLKSRAVNHYLPLVEVRHTYEKSRANFQVPLFPSYLFLAAEEQRLDWIKRDKRVVQVLPVPDPAILVQELEQIARVLNQGHPVDLYPQLRVGARCRINAGPLKGIEGEVERIGHRTRIYLRVSILAQSISVEVDATSLDYVDAAKQAQASEPVG